MESLGQNRAMCDGRMVQAGILMRTAVAVGVAAVNIAAAVAR